MRGQALAGLILIAGSAWIGRDLMKDGEQPWPAYAEPQASCGAELAGVHEGAGVHFRYPAGWAVTERQDKKRGVIETFLAPGGGSEVIVLLQEAAARASVVTIPDPPAGQKLRDAPNAEPAPPAEAVRLKDTDQQLAIDEKRNGNAYLTRLDEGPVVSFSWMAFVWDTDGRMVAVSGPKLVHSNWPNHRRRARAMNCAFWDVLRTVQPR
ncbi:MAG: hypothetical protein HY553_02015 [Elusimicrobia bacterium]|nr:hypothetical protein [Elusimicrobiota bacterium]